MDRSRVWLGRQCLVAPGPGRNPGLGAAVMRLLSSSGGCLTEGPILFSRDGEYIFACQDANILLLDGATGAPMARLEPPVGADAAPEPIVGLALHPSVSGILFAATGAGRIYRWNYETGQMLACISLPRSRLVALVGPMPGIFQADMDEGDDVANTLYAICHLDDESAIQRIYRIRVDATAGQAPQELIWELPRSTGCVPAVSADGRRLVFVREGRIHLWEVTKVPIKAELATFKPAVAPQHLALHPTEPTVYWSAPNGEIHSLDFITVAIKKTNGGADADGKGAARGTSKMHWHAHGIRALTMVPDGKHVLSGGEEGVLVLWSLEPYQRSFLPHLGSEIVAAAASPTHERYACLLGCNSVVLVEPGTMKVCGRYDGIKTDPLSSKGKIGGLVRDPRSPSAVLLNGIPGELQSFDPLQEGHLPGRDVDVCGQNLVGRGKGSARPVCADVFKVAFAAKGRWMATYDRRMTDIWRLQQSCLRFWRERAGQYHLYDVFDAPHREEIRQITFCPVKLSGGLEYCVTVGADGRCKVWNNSRRQTLAAPEVGKAVQQVCWREVATIAHRGLSCSAAAYSPDGSVLAIAFGRSARLYDSVSLALLGSLPAVGGSGGDLRELVILGDDWLVGTDGTVLFSWNLGSMALAWTLALQCEALRVHPDGQTLGLLCALDGGEGGRMDSVLLVKPTSPSPTAVYRHVVAREGQGLVGLEFIKRAWDSPRALLTVLDGRGMVHVVGTEEDAASLPIAEPNKYQRRRMEMATGPTQPEDVLSGVLKIKPFTVKPGQVPVAQRVLPPVNREALLLSLIPGHELPPNTVAFEHFIRRKLVSS